MRTKEKKKEEKQDKRIPHIYKAKCHLLNRPGAGWKGLHNVWRDFVYKNGSMFDLGLFIPSVISDRAIRPSNAIFCSIFLHTHTHKLLLNLPFSCATTILQHQRAYPQCFCFLFRCERVQDMFSVYLDVRRDKLVIVHCLWYLVPRWQLQSIRGWFTEWTGPLILSLFARHKDLCLHWFINLIDQLFWCWREKVMDDSIEWDNLPRAAPVSFSNLEWDQSSWYCDVTLKK